jgi:hypothetical protein
VGMEGVNTQMCVYLSTYLSIYIIYFGIHLASNISLCVVFITFVPK